MDESLQQLSQLFQDDDAEAILQVLADLESQNPLSRSASNNNIPASRKRDAFYPPTAVMSGGIQNQPRNQAVQKNTAATATNSNGKSSAPATASSDDAKPTAPFYYYKDYSKEIDPDPSVPVTAPGRIPNFPAKMYAILSRPDLQDIVSWLPHGRSWKVHKPREFEVKVIPSYFEHSKYSSFIRQANGWGFRRMISKGPNRNSYYHEMFLRSVPHMLKIMKRPLPSSKPLADASTEPDLFKISELCPLPETKDGSSGPYNFIATPQGPSHNAYIEAHEQHAASLKNLNQEHPNEQHRSSFVHHGHQPTRVTHPEAHGTLSSNVLPTMLPPGVKATVPLRVPSSHQIVSSSSQFSPPPSHAGPCPVHCCRHRHHESQPSNVRPLAVGGAYGRHHDDHLKVAPTSSRQHEDLLEPVPAFGPSANTVTAGPSSLEMPLINDVFDGVSTPNDDSFWLA